MQQSYARVAGLTEVLAPQTLLEDALRINQAGLQRHRVNLERHYEEVPPVAVDRHKALQILINLIRNAKYALDHGPDEDKHLKLAIAKNGSGRVKIVVADNGVGIPPENLTRIFQHGFTTKKDGHGFGLHIGALAARQMGGALVAHSDGPGRGAVFTLELPIAEEKTEMV
jgi:signal transduction histidine kinase